MDREPHSAATLADRRRPGRVETVSPHLLPLLRASERALLPPLPPEPYSGDRLVGAGQGVLIGMAGGALLWCGIAAAAWSLIG